MSDSREERVRAMQEKGTISKEQADELIAALRDEPEEGQDAGARQAHDARSGADSARNDADSARRDADRGEEHGRRRTRRRGDEWWSENSGWNPGTGGYEYRYRYRWDPTWWSGSNAQNFSRVEQPEGNDFEFKDNRVTFGKIRGLRLVRSKVNDNSFSASSVHDLRLTDSVMEGNSSAGASLHDLVMERGEMKGNSLAGTKAHDLSIRGGSTLKGTDLSGSSISSLSLDQESSIEDSHLSGAVIHDVTLSSASHLKGARLSGSRFTDFSLRSTRLEDTEISGSVLHKVDALQSEISGSTFRGIRMKDCRLSGAKLEKTTLNAVGFDDLRVENSVLKNVEIRADFDRLRRQAQGLSIQDTELENVTFVNCSFHDTTIRGIKASNLRIESRNLSDITIDSLQKLEELAGKQR